MAVLIAPCLFSWLSSQHQDILVGVAVELQPEKLCILRSVSGVRVLVTVFNLLSTR